MSFFFFFFFGSSTRVSPPFSSLSLSLSQLTVSKKTSMGEAKIVPTFAKKVCRAVCRFFFFGARRWGVRKTKEVEKKRKNGAPSQPLSSLSLSVFLSPGSCVSSITEARILIDGFSW